MYMTGDVSADGCTPLLCRRCDSIGCCGTLINFRVVIIDIFVCYRVTGNYEQTTLIKLYAPKI